MKSKRAIAMVLAMSACAQAPDVISLDDIRDARGDLPGFDSVINCNRAPRYIFDKHGEIVDTIVPIRHPSCEEKEAREIARQQARANRFPNLEASDDDVPRGPETPVVTVDPETTVPTEPDPPTVPVDTCNGAPHCEPDSKTEPEAYRLWKIEYDKRKQAAKASSIFSAASWF